MDDVIKESLSYDPDTGELRWLKMLSVRIKPGMVAGSIGPNGYRAIGIGGKDWYAHRIAWFLYYGNWPSGALDHINRRRSDNRIVNLREATMRQNSMNASPWHNSKSGQRGVGWDKARNKWVAYMKIGNRKIRKRFISLKDAIEYRHSLEEREFGEFKPDHAISSHQ